MLKSLPTITKKIVNEDLQPYFNEITTEINGLSGSKKTARILQYKRYIEDEAQKSDSRAIRMQLRINLAALLEKVGYKACPEDAGCNVKPKKYISVGLDELPFMHISYAEI